MRQDHGVEILLEITKPGIAPGFFALHFRPVDAGAKFVLLAPILPLAALVGVFFHGPWTPLRILGLTLLLTSFAMLSWARVNLGNSFSIAPKAKQLVTSGVYSKVRHPVYVSGALLISGIALYIPLHALLLSLIVIIPMQIARARAEERVLVEKFGEEYSDYKKTTWI